MLGLRRYPAPVVNRIGGCAGRAGTWPPGSRAPPPAAVSPKAIFLWALRCLRSCEPSRAARRLSRSHARRGRAGYPLMGINIPKAWNWPLPLQPRICWLAGRGVMAAAKQETLRRPRLDFPGYAQEFLRRSPDYCSQYARLIARRDARPGSQEVMARRWGLSFPARPPRVGRRRAGLLGRGGLPLCRHSRRGASRHPGHAALRSGLLAATCAPV